MSTMHEVGIVGAMRFAVAHDKEGDWFVFDMPYASVWGRWHQHVGPFPTMREAKAWIEQLRAAERPKDATE